MCILPPLRPQLRQSFCSGAAPSRPCPGHRRRSLRDPPRTPPALSASSEAPSRVPSAPPTCQPIAYAPHLLLHRLELGLNRGPCDKMWLLVFTSVFMIWVASLCKMFHVSSSPAKPEFLSRGGAFNKRNVLLVVAHPDDESMFFSPTISYLTAKGHNLHILCLSVGNADGLGNIRKEELYRACAVLKVPHQQVKVLDHPQLQDGFGKTWSHSLLSKIIGEEIESNGIDAIITFDNYGISGHCNHRDVHHAVRKLLRDTSQRDIEAWELASTSILRKYSGPVDIWISTLYSSQSSGGSVHCILNEQPWRSFRAMSEHSSQWVWFRKLFVLCSSYTYINVLQRISA